MTNIEFQALLNRFFTVEDGKVIVKDLTISDNIVKISVNDENNRLSGFQIDRNDLPPVNIIWDNDNETLNFTVGSDLATVNWNYPTLNIKEMDDTFFVKNEDILLVNCSNKSIYLPSKYNKTLTIKMIDGPCEILNSSFEVISQLHKDNTYRLVLFKGDWVFI